MTSTARAEIIYPSVRFSKAGDAPKEAGMSTAEQLHSGVLELHWQQDLRGRHTYQLYSRLTTGQMALLGTFDQGPFDTALDIAQWAMRLISREVPPAD